MSKVIPLPNINLEAEQSVLGSLLLKPAFMSQVAEILTPSDFYRESHKLIYRALLALHESEEPIDLVTVTQKLTERGQIEKCGGPVFLTSLYEQVGSASNVLHYAQIVKEAAHKRRLAAELQEVLSEIEKQPEGKVADFLTLADSRLEALREERDRLKRNRLTCATGNDLLSQNTSPPHEIIGDGILPQGAGLILAGDSGLGKSLLTLEIAARLSHGLGLWGLPVCQAVKVMIVQTENPNDSIKFRLERILTGLKLQDASRLLFAPPSFRLNLGEKEARKIITEAISRYDPAVVILDPLSSFHSEPENDNARMRGFLDGLTNISRETGVSWLIVHHHGKANEGETRYRGASAIKDWCDTLINLLPKKDPERTLLELDFAKVRHGPKRLSLILERDKNFVHFESMESSKVTSRDVVKALQKLNGHCIGQAALVREIKAMTGCGERTAYRAVRATIGRGIDSIEERGKTIYFLPSGLAEELCQPNLTNQ